MGLHCVVQEMIKEILLKSSSAALKSPGSSRYKCLASSERAFFFSALCSAR